MRRAPDRRIPETSLGAPVGLAQSVAHLAGALVCACDGSGRCLQAYADRGVLSISLFPMRGNTAGETTLRYREVVVGTVESIRFAPDLGTVIVSARVDKTLPPISMQMRSSGLCAPR